MSRRLLSTAAALMLAGGVYLSAGNAEASNMGFKLERSFGFVTGTQNYYLVSFPLFNGLGDVSDGSGCGMGDGVIDANDALCDLATDRDSSSGGALMAIQRLNEATCGFEGRTLLKTSTGVRLIGGFTSELTDPANREVGFIINVTKNAADPDVENRAVIVGSHDPSWTGKMVSRACASSVLNLPYHTMYRTASEVLCGLEGLDWDFDPDTGQPTQCIAGLYDPLSAVAVTVLTHDGAFVPRTALNAGGTVRLLGANFDLTPGDAYLFRMNTGYGSRLWLPPHF